MKRLMQQDKKLMLDELPFFNPVDSGVRASFEKDALARRIIQNRIRFKVLLEAFGVSIADAARAIKVSRSLLSRVLSGDDNINVDRVWGLCERHLDEIISLRTRTYLDLDGVSVEIAKAAFGSVSEQPNGNV